MSHLGCYYRGFFIEGFHDYNLHIVAYINFEDGVRQTNPYPSWKECVEEAHKIIDHLLDWCN